MKLTKFVFKPNPRIYFKHDIARCHCSPFSLAEMVAQMLITLKLLARRIKNVEYLVWPKKLDDAMVN